MKILTFNLINLFVTFLEIHNKQSFPNRCVTQFKIMMAEGRDHLNEIILQLENMSKFENFKRKMKTTIT